MDEGPGEHDAHLLDDDTDASVRCPRCGRSVWAYAQQCPHCSVHFRGEAWQLEQAGEGPADVRHWWWLLVAALVLGLLLITIF